MNEKETISQAREVVEQALRKGINGSAQKVHRMIEAQRRGEEVNLYDAMMAVDEANSWVEIFVKGNRKLVRRYGDKIVFTRRGWKIRRKR
jgi:flagellar hook-basal body complex protein FliE